MITKENIAAHARLMSERIDQTVARLVEQGLNPEVAAQAQECSVKLMQVVGEYEEAGVVALGLVLGVLEAMDPRRTT